VPVHCRSGRSQLDNQIVQRDSLLNIAPEQFRQVNELLRLWQLRAPPIQAPATSNGWRLLVMAAQRTSLRLGR